MNVRRAPALLCLLLLALPALAAPPQRRTRPEPAPAAAAAKPPVGPIAVDVDASEVTRDIFHTRLLIPASPGPLTLLYPQWIPGEHGPTGPILQMAGLKITAGGQTIPWRRDNLDNYTVHVDVPAGATAVEVTFDYLSPSNTSGFTAAASASENVAVVSWNTVVLYPAGYGSDELTYTASLKLPAGWKYGTALPVASPSGETIGFSPVSLTTLVDSPVLAGRHFRVVPIGGGDVPPHEIDIAAESEAELEMSPEMTDSFKRLVTEGQALFGAHHYMKYHFLVTLSDQVSHFGLEHHESSDDRTSERALLDDDKRLQFAGLLPHEFVHSWNGKYRRPADLATPDYQKPMQDDLLWVYEGLTEYLGYVLTIRTGLQKPDEFRDDVAHVAAVLDTKSGRTWRPIQDTATMAAQLYTAPGEWSNYRRSVDFYDEGVLLWLDVDTTIRKQTNGAKSIEDFVRLFHGPPSTAPMVKPYTFDDVVAALNQVTPYDWRAFLRQRLDTTDPHANFGGIESGGWRVVYTEAPNLIEKANESVGKALDLTFSGGLVIGEDGRVGDVVKRSAADRAGLSPGMTIIAVNGRKYSHDAMREVVSAAKGGTKPIDLIVQNGEYIRTTSLDYHDGLRFPHLERDSSKPDVLGAIMKPLK
jgi:predicted metalloprotease with PDZ domain